MATEKEILAEYLRKAFIYAFNEGTWNALCRYFNITAGTQTFQFTTVAEQLDYTLPIGITLVRVFYDAGRLKRDKFTYDVGTGNLHLNLIPSDVPDGVECDADYLNF